MTALLDSPFQITTPDSRIRRVSFAPTQLVTLGLGEFTSASTPGRWVLPWFQDWTQGAAVAMAGEHPVAELRRRSGLTWDQIGEILGVDRRTLHLWESGRPMRPRHQERLHRVLQVVRKADRGQAAATRQVLLETAGSGMLKDLLAQGDFPAAMARAEALPAPLAQAAPLTLSAEVRRSRRGRPISEQVPLVDTPVEIPILGPGHPAKVVRVGHR